MPIFVHDITLTLADFYHRVLIGSKGQRGPVARKKCLNYAEVMREGDNLSGWRVKRIPLGTVSFISSDFHY